MTTPLALSTSRD